jgi:thiol-disulfide isomerase/thioredoxin
MSSRLRYHAGVLAALLAVVVPAAIGGCQPAVPDANTSASQPAAPSISLRITGVEGYEALLARLRGKVVLVDFWATWCAPCIEQFPHTVQLHRKFHDRGLAVVGVSLNEPDEEPQVREFLTRQGGDFENLLSEYGSGVAAIQAFGLPGPVPCYRLYDRAGKLHREFTVDPRAKRQFTLADIEAAIAELL